VTSSQNRWTDKEQKRKQTHGKPKITRPISGRDACHLVSWAGVTDEHVGIFSALRKTASTGLRCSTDTNTFVLNKETALPTKTKLQYAFQLTELGRRRSGYLSHNNLQRSGGRNVNPTEG